MPAALNWASFLEHGRTSRGTYARGDPRCGRLQQTPSVFGLQVKHDLAKLQLTSPVCTKEGEKIALSRRVEKHWRLIGWGQIQKGLRMDMPGRS